MTPAQRREAVDHVSTTWQVSVRRVGSVVKARRSSYHCRGKRRPQAVLGKRIKEIAETRIRYGYRRIHVLLRREGWHVNAKRVRRIYRELGLQLRNKTSKRRVKEKLREGRSDAAAANEVWAMDFVHDQLFDGRKISVLTVVDTFSPLSVSGRRTAELPRRRCGNDPGTRGEGGRLSEDDPRGQRPMSEARLE